MQSSLSIHPRGENFTSNAAEGIKALSWQGKYGFVGFDGLKKTNMTLDGVNETGLSVGVFYHPGYASYKTSHDNNNLSPSNIATFLLSSCASINKVRKTIAATNIAPIIEPALGMPSPVHVVATEPSGLSVVIEFVNGQTQIYDNVLGVITNAPEYPWHMTNIRNYLKLSADSNTSITLDDIEFSPLGHGSGMIGLPGDFTPPSRFVRAVAFSHTARKTNNGYDAAFECFRILDSFNVPIQSAEGAEAFSEELITTKTALKSATLWTSAADLTNKVGSLWISGS